MNSEQNNIQFKIYAVAITFGLIPGAALMYFHENLALKSFIFSALPQLTNPSLAILIAGNILVFAGFAIAHHLFTPKCPSCNYTFSISNINTIFQTKNCTNCGANVIANKT